jgi:hypothetical protein
VQPQKGGSQVRFELAARTATVIIDTQPSGATVEIDGKEVGTTPATLTSLPPGKTVQYMLKKNGYQKAQGNLDVPGPGKETRIVLPLAISDELARVKLVSDPLGAQVFQNGQLLAGVQTPAEVLVEAGKTQRFMLTLPGHVPATLDPFAPARGAAVVKTAKLVAGFPIRLEASEGKVTVTGVPHCKDMELPADCIVANGQYTVELTAGPSKFTRQITVAGKPVSAKFELGTVEAADGKNLLIGGKPTKKALFEAGPHQVTIADNDGTHTVQVRVKAGATVTAK